MSKSIKHTKNIQYFLSYKTTPFEMKKTGLIREVASLEGMI
jgi:hypothetical protein